MSMAEGHSTIALILIGVAVVLIGVFVGGRWQAEKPTVRNRVPSLPESTLVAQKAAQDAQAAAVIAQQAQKDIQAQLELTKAEPKQAVSGLQYYSCTPISDCGPNEKSNPGIIIDFGMYDLLPSGSNSTDWYAGFNFTDRMGFSKRFFPVCPGQTVKTGIPITIMYHWKMWKSDQDGKRGCFMIDGFQTD